MKKQFLSIAVAAALFLCNYCFGGNVIDTYIATSTNATATELNMPTNLKGTGSQVAGQSSSPYDIKFTWNDNSTNEDGYKFQREKAGIYWNFGCQTGPNVTSITHQLSFMPEVTEEFRLCSYQSGFITDKKSPYSYVTVEMLRADLTVYNSTINKTTVNRGAQITISCQVNNIGTYSADPSTLGINIYNPGSSTGTRIGSIAIGALSIGANSGTKTATVTIPDNCMGNCTIKIMADANTQVRELSNNNNSQNKTITVLNSDLIILEPSWSKPDKVEILSCIVKNNGNLLAPSSTLSCYASTSSTGKTYKLGSINISQIAAGSQLSCSIPISILPSLSDGIYYYVFCADDNNQVIEGNETNNFGAITFEIISPVIPSTEKPYYEITNFSIIPSTVPNYVRTQLKIKNNGLAAGIPVLKYALFDITWALPENLPFDCNDDMFSSKYIRNAKDGAACQGIIQGSEITVTENHNIQPPSDIDIMLKAYIYNWDGEMTCQNATNTTLKSALSELEIQNNTTDILLYPNPTKGIIYLKNLKSFNYIKIFNPNGQEFLSQPLTKDNEESTLDLSFLDKGIYIVRLFGDNITENKKFVIE